MVKSIHKPMESSNTNPIKVLVVEDEPFITELYIRSLGKAGFDTKIVMDGREALNEIIEGQYDIVLLDIMLPNMLGTDILKHVRTEKPDLKSKIIISTNLELNSQDRAAIESQADGYVVKAELTPRQMADFLKQFSV